MTLLRPPVRVLALLLLVAAGACGGSPVRGDAEVDIALRTDPDPPVAGPVALSVRVSDLSWRPLNGAEVRLTATDPAGGEGPALATTGVGAGRYDASPVDLGPGEWSFTARIELAGGTWAEADFVVDVAEADGGG